MTWLGLLIGGIIGSSWGFKSALLGALIGALIGMYLRKSAARSSEAISFANARLRVLKRVRRPARANVTSASCEQPLRRFLPWAAHFSAACSLRRRRAAATLV